MVVTFTDAIGSRSYEVGTVLVGAQPAFTYQVQEPSVSVVVSGPVSGLDESSREELIAEVPVSDLEVGDNDVMPIVVTPPGTSVVRITPASVTVTVDRPT